MAVPGNLPQVNNQPLIEVGLDPVGRNRLPDTGIINLDATHSNEDPSTTVLKEVALRVGCSVQDLKDGGKNFTLAKDFGPLKGSNDPTPIHTYSNPPGPACYYLVRHWRVSIDGPNGREEMHFTKKIYTSVEVPRKLDAEVQTQQQYIAALAARTYSKIEESRMKVGNGQPSALFNSIEANISKISRDRFVTLEMFNNAEHVAINPSSKGPGIKNVTVDTIQMLFRPAKEGIAGEHPPEGFHEIILTSDKNPEKATQLKRQTFQFIPDPNGSPLEKKVATLLNKHDILLDILEGGKDPEAAFLEAGVSVREMKEFQRSEIDSRDRNFYSHMKCFGNETAVRSLMGDKISDEMTARVAPEPSIYKRIMNKQPGDLEALKRLDHFIETKNPSLAQKAEARLILNEAIRVYEIMKQEHDAIIKAEGELADMGLNDGPSLTADRQAVLDKMNGYIDNLELAELPPAPVQAQPQNPPQHLAQPRGRNPLEDQNANANAPLANPFAAPNPNPFAVPNPNPFAVPNPNPFAVPNPNPFAVPNPNPVAVPNVQINPNLGTNPFVQVANDTIPGNENVRDLNDLGDLVVDDEELPLPDPEGVGDDTDSSSDDDTFERV